jgi:hypothetical protein
MREAARQPVGQRDIVYTAPAYFSNQVPLQAAFPEHTLSHFEKYLLPLPSWLPLPCKTFKPVADKGRCYVVRFLTHLKTLAKVVKKCLYEIRDVRSEIGEVRYAICN